MRTTGVIGIVLSFSVAFTLLTGSGVAGDLFGQNEDQPLADVVEDQSDEADLDGDEDDGGFSLDTLTDDNRILGAVYSSSQFLTGLLANVALLPLTLARMGFPTYFAYPVGGVAQIIAFIGLFQFLTGRELL